MPSPLDGRATRRAALLPLRLGLLALAPACVLVSDDDLKARQDVDKDGVRFDVDCDDDDPAVGRLATYTLDRDGDGFAGDEVVEACARPAAAVDLGGDCDDDDAAVFPGAPDAAYDGVDADCRGEDADGNGAPDDYDQDGDGAAAAPVGADCDDANPAVRPGVVDVPYDGVDADCSGADVNGDGVLDDCDLDLDGAPFDDADDGDDDGCVIVDCDDADAVAVPDPTVAEVFYDGVDNNCLLTLEDGRPDTDGDADRDGFWAAGYRDRVPSPDATVGPLPSTFDDCWDDPDALPAGWVEQPVMAFDPTGDWEGASTLAWDEPVTAADTHPGALDRPYDTIDQDCAGEDANGDGVPDDMDWDGDGFASLYHAGSDGFGDDCLDCAAACAGVAGALADICAVVCDNDAYLGLADEDNLTNRGLLDSVEVNPGARETWGDGTDADCDRSSDFDEDRDLYAGRDYGDGEPWAFEEARGVYYSEGAPLFGGDCNDAVVAVRPDAADLWYDGVDQNCGDDDDFDADADGYVPTPYVGRSTAHGAGTPSFGGRLPGDDCNDADATFHPGRADAWYDGIDHDCAYNDDYDRDADRYIQTAYANLTTSQGVGTTPFGGGLPTNDCNDTQPTVYPGRAEAWYDGVDSDCANDDDFDADVDGYVPTAYVGFSTSFGAGVPTTFGGRLPGDDCNDTLASVRPGLADLWYDGVDTNCSDNDDFDRDGDGHVRAVDAGRSTSFGAGVSTTFGGALPADDCDDSSATVFGGAADAWYDGVDNDCAGNDDYDRDADGYARVGTYGVTIYVSGSGTLPNTDCNDGVSTVNPGRTDTWYDGTDSNCGGEDDYDRDGDGYVQTIHGGRTTSQGAGGAAFGGALASDDCNDTLSSVRPGLSDTWYDGVDTNCSDNDDYDRDADAYVQTVHVGLTTSYGAGSSLSAFGGALPGDDCNDTLSTVRPGLTDTWYDGIDTNCGDNDDFDRDADGYVQTIHAGRTTSYGAGASLAAFGGALPGDDCNDTLATVRPGLTDTWYDGVDTNCSDNDDFDQDADGYVRTGDLGRITSYGSGAGLTGFGGALPGNDCDDTAAAIRPSATEICDGGVDNDCDSLADDADPGRDSSTGTLYYRDADADTYGNPAVSARTCAPSTGYVANSLDCNDASAAVNPAGTEVCDGGVDNDCDGLADDADPGRTLASTTTFYRDADGDTYGNLSLTSRACVVPSGHVTNATDCNDAAAAVNPGATEVCDGGVDNNCNGLADDADGSLNRSTRSIFHRDLDTDTYGDAAVSSLACAAPAGYVSNDDDCDDTNLNINPGEDEVCDPADVDEDCSLTADDADPGVTGTFTTFYRDVDGDTYGIAAVTDDRCDAGGGFVATPGDCNDGAAAIRPGAAEVCDAVDNDCDALIDDADPGVSGAPVTYYRDMDGDGHGVPSPTATAVCAAPTGYATTSTDCDDTRTAVYLGAPELCDSRDNDCDALVDDADTLASGAGTLTYMDDDLDDYGDELDASPVRYCVVPLGRVANNVDCDDSDANINPGVAEIEDAIDQDCDDYYDEGFIGPESVIITEIMYRPVSAPSVGENNREWYELHNPGTVDVVIDKAWRVRDGSGNFVITTGTQFTVPAGGYAMVTRSADSSLNGGLPLALGRYVVVGTTLQLNNTGEALTVDYDDPLTPTVAYSTIDTVAYASVAPWPVTSSGSAGRSVQLARTAGAYPADNSLGSNWCLVSATATYLFGSLVQYGTPNAANVACPTP